MQTYTEIAQMFKSPKKCKMLMSFYYGVKSTMKMRTDISDINSYERFRNGMLHSEKIISE